MGPTPRQCLAGTGLKDVHSPSAGEWTAKDPLGGASLFVDGPFVSHADAGKDGDSLSAVQAVGVGGLYVVTANLNTHEGGTVRAVAKCLAPSRGHGGMRF